MPIWAIADIHASATEPESGRPVKSMDVFGKEWENHMERLEDAWRRDVAPDDTVIVAGDIDWALHLDDAMETLHRLAGWPGRKILLRGNHDYWWSSKTTGRVRRALPPGIDLLHNNAFEAEGFNIVGTKGSPIPGGIDWSEENAKLLNRETQRLELSLSSRDPSLPTIAALHYPPFYPAYGTSPYREALERAGVSLCVYGHLHGGGGGGPRGVHGGVEYVLVAGDAVGFRPVQVARDGQIVRGDIDMTAARSVS
ncbi:MAG TPA: metallophosphoesterase [Chloroflexota bacterium]|nr:metallophosphoesterase [Chloroflexota bacterium]